MLAGALELQLLADVARLKQDMDKAQSVVSSAAAGMKRAAEEVKAALGGMVAGLSVAAVASFVKSTIEATAKLHDLSIVSGVAVEQLSALASVGKLSGTSADVIASASNKLSKALATTNEESKGAATALKALGLNFNDFQRLKPDERIQRIALAMGAFQDGGQKSAAAMLLFGKTGADMLPFLKDLAETGKLHAKVTTDQAAAADAYEDNLVKLRGQADGWKKQLALELLPTLKSVTDELLEIKKAANDRDAGKSLLGETLTKVFQTVGVLGNNVLYVLKQTGIELGGIAAQVAAILSGNWGRVGTIREEMKRDAAEARRAVDQRDLNLLGITTGERMSARTDPRSLTFGSDVPSFKRQLTGLEGDGTGGKAEDGQKQYDALVKRINERIALGKEELALGRELTEQEKFANKVRADAAELLAKFPGLHQAEIEKLLEKTDAQSLSLQVQRSELELAKQIATARQSQKNTDYQQSEQALHDLNAEYAASLKSVKDRIKDFEAENEATKLAEVLNISLAEAIEMVTIKRLEEKKAGFVEGSDGAKAIQQEIEERKKLLGLMHDRSEIDKQREAWKQVEDAGLQVFRSLFDHGKSAFEKLRDILKNTLVSLLEQLVARPFIIQLGASLGIPGAQMAAQSLGGGGSMLGSLFGNAAGSSMMNPILSAAGLSGSWLGGAGATLANAVGFGSGASAFGMGGVAAGMSGAAEATAMEATLMAGGTGAGALAGIASTIGTAMPYIGVALLAAQALGLFDHGGPKTESGAGFGVAQMGDPSTANAQIKAIEQAYSDLTKNLGGAAKQLQVGVFMSQDTKGTAKTILDVDAAFNGAKFYDRQNRFGNNVENVGRSEGELQAAMAEEVNRVLLGALQASDIGGAAGDYLRSLGDLTNAAADKVQEALARVQKIATERAALDEQVYVLTHTAEEKMLRDREREIDALDEGNRALGKRVQILQDEKAAAATLSSVLQRAAEEVVAFRSFVMDLNRDIRGYIDGLNSTSRGGGSLLSQKDAAFEAFMRQIGLARSGDRAALQGITGYANSLIDAQTAYTATSKPTQDIIAMVKQELSSLPQMMSDAEYIAKSISDASAAQIAAGNAASADLQTRVTGSIQLVREALKGQSDLLFERFGVLDHSVDGLLTFEEVKAALGGVASDATLHAMIERIDANGDGQISKLEALNSSILAGLFGSAGLIVEKFFDLDQDLSSLLDFGELKAAVGPLASDDTIRALIAVIDANGDQQISKQEATIAAIREAANAAAGNGTTATPAPTTPAPTPAAPASALPDWFSQQLQSFISAGHTSFLPNNDNGVVASQSAFSSYEELTQDLSGSNLLTGLTPDQRTQALGEAATLFNRYRMVGSFDVGTNRVPYDMLAIVHKDEQIIPARDNPYANPYRPDPKVDTSRIETLISQGNALMQRLLEVEAAGHRGAREHGEEIAQNTRSLSNAAKLAAAKPVPA